MLFSWFGDPWNPLNEQKVNGEMFSNFRIVSTLHANWIQKWTFLQKLKTQNWFSIKILHYRPLQHADRPKLSELWQKMRLKWFLAIFRVIFWRHCLFFNFTMKKPRFWPLLKVPHGLPMKNLQFGAFRVLLRLNLKLLMSKMPKTIFFSNFPRVPTFTQNWMQKWIFLQILNL